jgi:hypothetical protein
MRIARVFAPLALLAALACSSLQPVADPFQFITETKPPLVYVAYETGAVMVLNNPRVAGDSVIGTVPGESRSVALSRRQVQSVSTVRRHTGRTAMLIGGLVGAAGVVTYAVLINAKGDDAKCDYSDPKDNPNNTPACDPIPQ